MHYYNQNSKEVHGADIYSKCGEIQQITIGFVLLLIWMMNWYSFGESKFCLHVIKPIAQYVQRQSKCKIFYFQPFQVEMKKLSLISLLCCILFPFTSSPFLSPEVCTLTVFMHWSYWRRQDFVLYQEMGLDKGMELSTLGKAFN